MELERCTTETGADMPEHDTGITSPECMNIVFSNGEERGAKVNTIFNRNGDDIPTTRGRGQPRRYATTAAKKRAYRQRQKARRVAPTRARDQPLIFSSR